MQRKEKKMLSVTSFELEKKRSQEEEEKKRNEQTHAHTRTHTPNFYLIKPCLLSITDQKTRKKKYIYL
jgi:hypothetical protein